MRDNKKVRVAITMPPALRRDLQVYLGKLEELQPLGFDKTLSAMIDCVIYLLEESSHAG
ncbi:MAG: hypothetical protein IT393_04250 [Nitrospirae bacterium]|nr:hypothetical protein [Nitrospirota bacterium]